MIGSSDISFLLDRWQNERKGDLNAPGMLLTGRRGQLKYFSQFGNELAPHLGGGGTPAENYNVCIACIAGSGKSVLMEEMMLSTLGIGGKVFVLDYGKSFKNLCIELGGGVIPLSVATSRRKRCFGDRRNIPIFEVIMLAWKSL